MKKVIAAAAGLMLTGALVTTASAAVSFSGDARVRGYYETNYDFGEKTPPVVGVRSNEEDIKANSRVRLKINGDAKGGAYIRTRILIANGTLSDADDSKTSVDTDYGYLGIPIGPVTIEAGLIPANVTDWFYWDVTQDMITGTWSNDMTEVQIWYNKNLEAPTKIDDNDVTTIWGILKQKFAGDWGILLAGYYKDDQLLDDRSGFSGTFNVTGPAGPVSLMAEISYQDADLGNGNDNGYGGIIQGSMNFGATSAMLMGGWAQDGFVADKHTGFMMLGSTASVAPKYTQRFGAFNGQESNTVFFGGSLGFKASEALSLTGNLAYADFDNYGDGFEISGTLKYIISDGADLQWDMGYLAWNADGPDEDSPFGSALTLNMKF